MEVLLLGWPGDVHYVKEELDMFVEFLRRRDFLKPFGIRVIGQGWMDQLFTVFPNPKPVQWPALEAAFFLASS